LRRCRENGKEVGKFERGGDVERLEVAEVGEELLEVADAWRDRVANPVPTRGDVHEIAEAKMHDLAALKREEGFADGGSGGDNATEGTRLDPVFVPGYSRRNVGVDPTEDVVEEFGGKFGEAIAPDGLWVE
jgi:hypothetical protein